MEIDEIRKRINTINDEMLNLFMERMKLSEAVAEYKKEHNLPILDKTREREILAEMSDGSFRTTLRTEGCRVRLISQMVRVRSANTSNSCSGP